MTTYSVRCRKCRHRRVSGTHPEDYKVVPKCDACGAQAGWRIEGREYNKRGLCHCNGPCIVQRTGENFPHRVTHRYCDHHPDGIYNQARARGVAHADIPVKYWPKEGP